MQECHGTFFPGVTDALGPKEKKSFGLEQKSKVSRSRVHYMKFTKGTAVLRFPLRHLLGTQGASPTDDWVFSALPSLTSAFLFSLLFQPSFSLTAF